MPCSAYHLAGHPSSKTTLQWLAEASGGAVFDVAEKADLESAATAHQGRPWTITEITAPGANEVLIQGSSKSVYPGQAMVLAGRGAIEGPIEMALTRDGENRTLRFDPEITIASPSSAVCLASSPSSIWNRTERNCKRSRSRTHGIFGSPVGRVRW